MLINFRWKWCRKVYRCRNGRAMRMLGRWQHKFERAWLAVLNDPRIVEPPLVFRRSRPTLKDCVHWVRSRNHAR